MRASTFTHRELSAEDVAQLLADAGYEISPSAIVERTVLDSFDGRLHEAGLLLESHRPATTGTAGVPIQLVLNDVESISASIVVKRSPRFVSDLKPGPFRSRLAPLLEMRALLPVVAFTDRATSAIDRDGADKTVVSLHIHEPIDIATGGGRVPMLVEVVEHLGHPKPAGTARMLLTNLGFESVDASLTEQVMAAAKINPSGYSSEPTVPLDSGMPAIDGFRSVFENLAATMAANWPGTIADIDTEFLHELRVAIRRTRSVLGHAKDVIPDETRQRYRDDFAWLASLTGPTRDLDVYILGWDQYVGDLNRERSTPLEPVLLHLQQHRARAFRDMVKHLQSDRAQSLVSDWNAALRQPTIGPSPAPKALRPLGTVVANRIRSAHKELIDNGREISETSPAQALHDLRKDAKKLRYAIECFGGVLPNSARKAFVRQLKGLQDNLGEHQDAEVHSTELRAVADELSAEHAKPATLVALGQLTERLEVSQRAARAEFSQRFAAYDSHETTSIFGHLLHSIENP